MICEDDCFACILLVPSTGGQMDVALTESVGLSNGFESKTKIFPKRDARPGFRGCGELFFDFCEAGGCQAVELRGPQD